MGVLRCSPRGLSKDVFPSTETLYSVWKGAAELAPFGSLTM
ncbi:hypothetical protein [Pedobacter sp. ok626]|nr:hypothetical protein [Pedobacter sp. ok626]